VASIHWHLKPCGAPPWAKMPTLGWSPCTTAPVVVGCMVAFGLSRIKDSRHAKRRVPSVYEGCTVVYTTAPIAWQLLVWSRPGSACLLASANGWHCKHAVPVLEGKNGCF
jgi:hypothetical protein